MKTIQARVTVKADRILTLQLPEEVLWYVRHGKMSAGHARALITAPNPAALAEQIVNEGLNVRQAEVLARRASEGPKPGKVKARTGGAPGEGHDALGRLVPGDVALVAVRIEQRIDHHDGGVPPVHHDRTRCHRWR